MKRWLFSLSMIAMLTVLCRPVQLMAAGAAKPAAQDAAAPADPAADQCGTCHADVVKNFSTNPHSRIAEMHTGKGVTCENCHGNGQAHMESGGDPTKIINPKKATAKQINATCLTCHSAAHPDFEHSPHGKADLSCISCHSVHESKTQTGLLKMEQPKLCYTCHSDTKASFAQTFHHKVNEGVVKCNDCHDPHGTFLDKNLKSTADQNAVCTKCHTETAGPFAYEHPVVKTEGCVSCHSPHGSPNPRLLNVGNVNTLCLSCHSATNGGSMAVTTGGVTTGVVLPGAFPHAVSPTGPAHNQNAQYVSCTTCHTQIHGSNASAIYFK
ncbi:MAG TPA: DmsE family decaheme c-type cytochrome [Acidobacteriaceae bacterium]